jgi:ABC-type nitrate/sulfonate/bicarbonate transport system substrate-binding protein
VRIVADRGHHALGACATSAILLRAGLDPLRLPATLRVSATPALVEEFMLDRARQLLGGESERWRLTDLPRGTESVALAGGAIDLMQADEPVLTRILDEGLARVWRTYAQLQPEMQSHVVVFGPRLLDRERDLGARFLAGYLAEERELAAGPNRENVAAMAEVLDLDPELARRICWPAVRADLSVDVESLQVFQRWAAGKGLLDRVVAPGEYWDGDLARRALGLMGSPK